MGNFDIIGVRLMVAHVSFPSSIGERKAVFIPDNTDPDEPIGSMTEDPPQLIAVKTNCNVRQTNSEPTACSSKHTNSKPSLQL